MNAPIPMTRTYCIGLLCIFTIGLPSFHVLEAQIESELQNASSINLPIEELKKRYEVAKQIIKAQKRTEANQALESLKAALQLSKSSEGKQLLNDVIEEQERLHLYEAYNFMRDDLYDRAEESIEEYEKLKGGPNVFSK